ncbi:MAG: polysaccharide deacetylase family protein [Patescibacteria group bacterium]|nr:polysaccharide deacetylase family protein [Patescibacteria group bacterium]
MPLWKWLLLNAYYHGTRPVRWLRLREYALAGRVPAVVLFYHRVADDFSDGWTISNRTFTRQIRWLKRHFNLVSLSEVQRIVRSGENQRPCVSITFDDGYADNCHEAIPLLIKERIPCTYFVTARNVLDGVPFPHDVAAGCPLPPNSLEQLRAMADAGIEIGAHTYTHPDLGRLTDPKKLRHEIVAGGEALADAIGRPMRYFAFPFGQYRNMTPAAFLMAREAGYDAVCSAYGGYNFPGDDPFHIQRIAGDPWTVRLKNWATIDPRKVSIRPCPSLAGGGAGRLPKLVAGGKRQGRARGPRP